MMKKLIITTIFFLNILPNIYNNQISIDIACNVYAQYGCPPDPTGSGSGTSPNWWETFTSWIDTIVSAIGELFSGNGDPSDPNSYNGYPTITWYGTDPGNGYSTIDPNGGSGAGGGGYYIDSTNTSISNTGSNVGLFITPYYSYWSWGEDFLLLWELNQPYIFTYDCQGVLYGTARMDICHRCIGGTTGLTACSVVVQNDNDTIKPTKVNCDSIDANANIRSAKSTQILDGIKDSAITKNARDSAPYRKFEVGFTIVRAQPTPGNFTYRPALYVKDGSSRNVNLVNYSTSVANLHVHPAKDSAGNLSVESQSPVDYYALLENWNDTFYVGHKFDRAYVISGDTFHNEYAIVIADTAKAKDFLTKNPRNTVINSDTSSKYKNNWFGDEQTEGTFYYDYVEAIKLFEKEGYPKHLLDTYANVYMLQARGVGIKLEQKVNGQFKELNFVEQTINGKKHYKITICQ